MKYADISLTYLALKKLENSTDPKYWDIHKTFQIQLRDALCDDELMQRLTKPQLLQVLAWCSTYRPHEPHVILAIFGKLSDPVHNPN